MKLKLAPQIHVNRRGEVCFQFGHETDMYSEDKKLIFDNKNKK